MFKEQDLVAEQCMAKCFSLVSKAKLRTEPKLTHDCSAKDGMPIKYLKSYTQKTIYSLWVTDKKSKRPQYEQPKKFVLLLARLSNGFNLNNGNIIFESRQYIKGLGGKSTSCK